MKIKTYIFTIVALLYFTGCEGYLNSVPYSFTTVDNFYKTAKDAELALTGCYSVLIADYIQGTGPFSTFAAGSQIMLSAGTDELFLRDGVTTTEWMDFGTLGYNPDEELIRKNWFFFYAGINRTNYLLENIDQTEMNEERKQEIKGEAHFLRGLFYMYLGMQYGGVPVFTTSAVDMKAPRNSLQEVFEQVIEDYQFAYKTLPDRASVAGRANKWSAAGFLAKVYAYLGSCRHNNVGTDLNFPLNNFDWVDSNIMYSNLLNITEDIVDNSGYKLTQEYDRLFRETTETYQYEECLFTVESSQDVVTGSYYLIYLYFGTPIGSPSLYGGGYAHFRPAGEVWYKYVAQDIRRDHNLGIQLNANCTTKVVDGVTYYIPYQYKQLTINPNYKIPLHGNYCCTKFLMMDPAEKAIPVDRCGGNYPLLRFADILLLRAEALYYTGDEPGARAFLTQVRQRAVVKASAIETLNNTYYKADFIEELLDERTRELCFESQRRIDLIRFNKYGQALSVLSSDKTIFGQWNIMVTTLQQNWQSFKIWFPIPSSQIAINPSLIQNPGY